VILGVPIVDTAFSFFRRVARRQSFAVADKDHLHHRLMRLGHGPRRTVVILWLWTALLSGLALLPRYTRDGGALVPFGVLALALLLYALFFPGKREAQAILLEEELATAASLRKEGSKASVVDLEERRQRAADSG
jgi:UDP-GlcNAc:undecaprenyl-phosphate GlcNAc-1-phosphate transferase